MGATGSGGLGPHRAQRARLSAELSSLGAQVILLGTIWCPRDPPSKKAGAEYGACSVGGTGDIDAARPEGPLSIETSEPAVLVGWVWAEDRPGTGDSVSWTNVSQSPCEPEGVTPPGGLSQPRVAKSMGSALASCGEEPGRGLAWSLPSEHPTRPGTQLSGNTGWED